METIVLIPHYNNKEILDECLISLRGQTYKNFKTIVIDDGSTDDSVDYVKEKFPEVDVLALNKNFGFAKAVNKGINFVLDKYRPAFIAVLNNDTRADAGWLAALVKRAKSDDTIAAVTSNILFYDHPEIVNSQGGTLDWNGDGYDINFGIRREKGKKESGDVIGACFGASLIRSIAFHDVGILDKKFGAYFEDLDWSWRANLFGYRVCFEKEAVVYHKHSASYRSAPYRKLYLCKKNALRAAIKNYEIKNLPRQITYILIGYWFAIVGYFQKDKHQLSLAKRFVFVSIPFFALLWNIVHLAGTLIERSRIQKRRKRADEIIIKLAMQDLTPVRMWVRNLKIKFSIWRFFIPFAARAKHKIFLPFFNLTKHRVVLPIAYQIKNLNERFMQKNLFGAISAKNFFKFTDKETVDIYFKTALADLPFRLAFTEKSDFFKNESAFVIDACIVCLQLSFYHDPSIFRLIPEKISDAASRLEHTPIDWNKVTALGKQANASSQLYFYLHLIEESGTIKLPKKTIEEFKQSGSRMQNILLNRIKPSELLRGKPSFFLKLYSKMYLEWGLLKYITTKIHALYNNKKRGACPVRNPSRQRRGGNRLERFISNGVNIFGFIDSESGVGEAARTLIRSVERAHIPYTLINSDQAPHRRKETQFSKKFGNANPYLINLIVIYGDMFGSELNRFGREKFENHYNIAYWAWELSILPPEWIPLLNNMNEVWTPSVFSARTIQEARKDVPVTVIPHAIEIKKYPYSRARFGLPENTFLFLFMFDFYSIFERKNPLAVLRAFKNAFTPNDRVALVIKCSNNEVDKENFEKLKLEAEEHRIFLIHKYLEREEVNSLMNVCDCYVSLHRSEGFGLSIAEAMALRKPVIATNYSGNTDFMNEKNSFPIPYKLVSLKRDYGPYRKGNVWAEPNEREAAKCMRLIYEAREVAARKGMFAQRDIVIRFSPDAVGRLVARRLHHLLK